MVLIRYGMFNFIYSVVSVAINSWALSNGTGNVRNVIVINNTKCGM